LGQEGAAAVILLDAGALIAFERGDARMRALLREAIARKIRVLLPAPVLAQVWRRPAEQVALRALSGSRFSRVIALDGVLAEAVGALCASTKTRDVVDATVAILAKRYRAKVFTTDPKDIRKLDPTVSVEAC
jgi:predicted nucleic acid-binding protein